MIIEDNVVDGRGDCNTPILTPFALNVYDVNIVINHGEEPKEKSLPLIYRFMIRRLKSMPMVFCASWHIIILDIV